MTGETVVVTGGNGFVGRHLIEEARERWPKARLMVWDARAIMEGEGVESAVLDITDTAAVGAALAEVKPDWVIHLAAIAAVPVALKDPELVRRVNTEATHNLLAAAKGLSPATKFLVISTADIYGQGTPAPLLEMPLDWAKPQNPYAISKWEMEKVIEEKFNDQVIRVRPFPHIGPGQGVGFVTADFASQVARAERGEGKAVVKVGNLRAERDFTDVRDVVKAYCLLVEAGRLGEVYHVASGRAVSVQWILNSLIEMAEKDIEVVMDEGRMRPSDVPVLIGDATKLKKETGWEPEIGIEKSLVDVLNWWRKNSGA